MTRVRTLPSALKPYIPAPLWSFLRNGYFRLRRPGEFVRDRWTSLGGVIERLRRPDLLTDVPTPPDSLIAFVGGHDFKLVGEVLKGHFVNLAQLHPHHKVLDVGCGVGRVAVALTSFLSSQGEYWGIDITKRGIQWCRKEITTRYPNFHFEWCDVHNKAYHPTGKRRASTYTFPFPDGTFDFVFLTSVFTHMLPSDYEHYLSESSRVVKPGGKCLATFFLLNEESRKLMASGASNERFAHQIDGCWVADKNMPEAAVAYEEAGVRHLYEQLGFQTGPAVFYGAWCGRGSFVDYQDMIIATKSAAQPLRRA
jgi:ubiquinone/menaquinone biosynthesis C-methylase UbiE